MAKLNPTPDFAPNPDTFARDLIDRTIRETRNSTLNGVLEVIHDIVKLKGDAIDCYIAIERLKLSLDQAIEAKEVK